MDTRILKILAILREIWYHYKECLSNEGKVLENMDCFLGGSKQAIQLWRMLEAKKSSGSGIRKPDRVGAGSGFNRDVRDMVGRTAVNGS